MGAPRDEGVVLLQSGIIVVTEVAVGEDCDNFRIRKRPSEAAFFVAITEDVGLESHGGKRTPGGKLG